MFKKFSFWIVFVLVASIGSMAFIHWNTIRELHQKTAGIQPLYQRQKAIDALSLSLERYRRMSASFRKLQASELTEIKNRLRLSFSNGVRRLDQLDPSSEEKVLAHQLDEEIAELLRVSAHIEPQLFSQDAYQKLEIQSLHDEILSTLARLEKSTQVRIEGLRFDSSKSQSNSLVFLLAVGALILILVLSLILRNYFIYVRPLKRLHLYASQLRQLNSVPSNVPHFIGIYGDIQRVLNHLAFTVDMHMRDRHKFIADIVADLKLPLSMLQSGKYLLEDTAQNLTVEQQNQAAESVKRGLAIFSGSLDDLNDIIDINRLESRLQEKTVDLCELITDVSRTLVGVDLGKRISIFVPPIPLWVSIDIRRFERIFIQLFSKLLSILPSTGGLSVSVSQIAQGSFRGVEVVIQDSERSKSGRPQPAGPDQDILKHWISENGLSMALVHKVIKAHGGTITAAGVAGTSVTITLRLPHERVVTRGLISPPSEDGVSTEIQGLVVHKQRVKKRVEMGES